MHIGLSQETLEPDRVGREVPLRLTLAEVPGQHNSRTSRPAVPRPEKRLLPTVGLQKQAEGLSTQAAKPKVTTVGSSMTGEIRFGCSPQNLHSKEAKRQRARTRTLSLLDGLFTINHSRRGADTIPR